MQNKILDTIKLQQERLDLPKIKEGCLVRVNVNSRGQQRKGTKF